MRRIEAILLLGAVALGWGTAWPVTKAILEYLPPLWTAAVRSLIGTVTLFAIAAARGPVALPPRGDWPVVLNVSILHMVAFSALVACGLQFVPAGRSIVLGYTTPLWVMAGARIFLGERLTRTRVLGMCIGLLGLMLLFDPSDFDWGDQAALLGNALVMLGAFCWAISILHIRAHKWIATPFELVPWQALIATAILIPLACLFEGVLRVGMAARAAWPIALRRNGSGRPALLGHAERQPQPAGNHHRARLAHSSCRRGRLLHHCAGRAAHMGSCHRYGPYSRWHCDRGLSEDRCQMTEVRKNI